MELGCEIILSEEKTIILDAEKGTVQFKVRYKEDTQRQTITETFPILIITLFSHLNIKWLVDYKKPLIYLNGADQIHYNYVLQHKSSKFPCKLEGLGKWEKNGVLRYSPYFHEEEWYILIREILRLNIPPFDYTKDMQIVLYQFREYTNKYPVYLDYKNQVEDRPLTMVMLTRSD